MSIRIVLEIGHGASIRTKITPEGFTHDWEIYVRGCDGDIHHYVEKVVFNLHATFTKPRRVIKDPPYILKESGYAGFNLPIDIYLKNSGEPKKISFNYDLHIQPSGPPISKVQKEKYVFHHFTDDFRMRLLKGGGTVVNPATGQNDNSRDNSISMEDRGQLIDKPKLGGDLSRKHKIKSEETKISNSFADLFGPPITKAAKVSPDPKSQIKSSPKSSIVKSEKSSTEKSKNKHSPHKDKSDRDKSGKNKEYDKKSRDEKRNKDKSKERERSREIVKREKSPKRLSTSPRRSPKREPSPKKVSSPKRMASPLSKLKVDERSKHDDTGQKEKVKLIDAIKVEKKLKKEKREKGKEKDRDRKEHKSHKDENRIENEQKETKMAFKEMQKPVKENSKEKEQIKNKDKLPKSTDVIMKEDVKTEKQKSEKHETNEKHRHKHKKKDREKNKKEEKDREKEKERKHDRKVCLTTKTNSSKEDLIKITVDNEKESPLIRNSINVDSYLDTPLMKDKPSNPINALIAELSDNDSSDSSNNSLEGGSLESSASKNQKFNETKSIELPKESPTDAAVVIKDKAKLEPDKADKVKKSKKHKEKYKVEKSPDKDLDKKRKRKSSQKTKDATTPDKLGDERPVKLIKEDVPDVQIQHDKVEIKSEDCTKISPDYMCILKDLQQKIMTLQDNSDLQRVVQLIVETGQYEITRQTFDFDLCALDHATVKRLQDFFATT